MIININKIRKRGQITVFIILGLILLVAIAAYISVRQLQEGEKAAIPKIEEVPSEFQPIRAYVESCLKIKAEEGLKLAMDHGGYIKPEAFGIMENSANPTSSNGVSFPGNWVIPYWYYLKSDNRCIKNCEFSTEKPPLKRDEGSKSIEAQLDSYIESKIGDCIKDFESFRKEGYNVAETGDIVVASTVLDNDILFVMGYPLVVTKDGVTKDIKDFYVRIPVRLMDMYNLAVILSNLEQQYRFLERDAVQLIVGFSGLDEEKLPPMSESRFGFGGEVRWRKGEVKEEIESMLSSYVQLLRAQNTLNFEEFSFGDPIKDALYNIHMIIPMDEDYNHLSVSFNYLPIWPVYLDLNCEGEICEPMSASQSIIALFGIQRYEFAYDLSFPVMVEIYDPSAFNDKGYYFRYFLEGNIRNNEVMRHNFWPLESIDLATGSMLCDIDKRNSGEITVDVNNYKGDAIDDANVVYTCGEESCTIGTTSKGKLKEKFPVCVGGFITATKEGHITSSKVFSTILDKDDKVDIQLEPFMEKKFKVKKKRIVKTGDYWVFNNNEVNIDREEQAIIILTRVGALGDENYIAAAEYYGNQSIYGAEDSIITIAPGTYDIDIQLYDNKRFVIPEETRETNTGIFGIGNEEYTIPKIELNDSWPSGGLTMRYEFKAEDLENNERIVFFVPSPALTLIPENERQVEDLEQLGRFNEYSYAYVNSLIPRFE